MEIDTKVLAVHARLIRSGLDPDYAQMKLSQLPEERFAEEPDHVAKRILSEAPEKFVDRSGGEAFLERVWDRIEAEKEARRNGGTGEGGGEPGNVYDRIRERARADRDDTRTASEKLDERLQS